MRPKSDQSHNLYGAMVVGLSTAYHDVDAVTPIALGRQRTEPGRDLPELAESIRYVQRYPQELPELAELLPQIATPVTLINGRHDPVVPISNVEFLDERLPNSRIVLIDAGHFVWEEAPAEYARIVLDSIR